MTAPTSAGFDPRTVRRDLSRFLMLYRFGNEEVMTKVNILKDEFRHVHDYSPIEHVSSRIKSPEAILGKAVRKGVPLTLESIRAGIMDIAGVRITCSFLSDTYRVRDMLVSQADILVLQVKDYIAHPKANGYQSLHLIVEIPVFLSDRVEAVPVEIQIRTIAMDFWASLEHKIYYKYDGEVPTDLVSELRQAADVAARLDVKMQHLHEEVRRLDDGSRSLGLSAEELGRLPFAHDLLAALGGSTAHDDGDRRGGQPATEPAART